MPIARFTVPANADVVLWFIQHRPGITERELSEVMFAKNTQPHVNGDCRLLEQKGLIERRGADPLRLYLKN